MNFFTTGWLVVFILKCFELISTSWWIVASPIIIIPLWFLFLSVLVIMLEEWT